MSLRALFYRRQSEPSSIDVAFEDAVYQVRLQRHRQARRYTLRVQGTNRAGRWSPYELRLPVVVLPAWYETAWFRLLAAVDG